MTNLHLVHIIWFVL